MNRDYHDILTALVAAEARFLIVGAHALAAHGYPRATVDLGLTFARTWPNRAEETLEGVRVPVIGRDDLIANKRASGRDRDRADIQGLEGRS